MLGSIESNIPLNVFPLGYGICHINLAISRDRSRNLIVVVASHSVGDTNVASMLLTCRLIDNLVVVTITRGSVLGIIRKVARSAVLVEETCTDMLGATHRCCNRNGIINHRNLTSSCCRRSVIAKPRRLCSNLVKLLGRACRECDTLLGHCRAMDCERLNCQIEIALANNRELALCHCAEHRKVRLGAVVGIDVILANLHVAPVCDGHHGRRCGREALVDGALHNVLTHEAQVDKLLIRCRAVKRDNLSIGVGESIGVKHRYNTIYAATRVAHRDGKVQRNRGKGIVRGCVCTPTSLLIVVVNVERPNHNILDLITLLCRCLTTCACKFHLEYHILDLIHLLLDTRGKECGGEA